jgi:putative transposase
MSSDLRIGRHVVYNLHVHLVFVAKYRRKVFDAAAIDRLRELFAKVCVDFESQLVEMDGERDHVHLLVSYPPKVSVSALVNSLKDASSRVLWSPSYFASSCGGAPVSIIRQYIEQQATPT